MEGSAPNRPAKRQKKANKESNQDPDIDPYEEIENQKRRNLTLSEKKHRREDIAAQDKENIRIAVEIIRRGAPHLQLRANLAEGIDDIPTDIVWQLYYLVRLAAIWKREAK